MPNLPSFNHVIACSSYGGPEVLAWGTRPMSEPAPGEILIKVAAAGVNRADLLQRRGKYPPPLGASDVLGLEVSGYVAACGHDVHRWRIGDRVCAILSGGGYAEYVVVPEGQCLPVPSPLSMIEAAGVCEAVFTVWSNVFETAFLKPHETILVHGGASGIGTTAIQMVKALGAKIFVTVGKSEKGDVCRKLGADLVINYRYDDFVEVIRQHTKNAGVDVVLDMIGADYVAKNISILALGGRHISIATQGGAQANLDIREIMRKRAIVTGSTLRSRSVPEKDLLRQKIEARVWPWIEKSLVKPLIYQVIPIKNAGEAHKMMESGEHIGKIILEVAV